MIELTAKLERWVGPKENSLSYPWIAIVLVYASS
jgi:hypothetical protein